MPRTVPILQPLVVSNVPAGSFFVVHGAATSLDGNFIDLSDVGNVHDVSASIARLAMSRIADERGTSLSEPTIRRLVKRHIDEDPKRMFRLSRDDWDTRSEELEMLTAPISRVETFPSRLEKDNAEFDNWVDSEKRMRFCERPDNSSRLATVPTAEIDTRNGRHYIELGGVEHDVTASVAPIVNRLAKLNKGTPMPMHLGVPLVSGWHRWELETRTRPERSARSSSPDPDGSRTGQHFISLHLESARPEKVEEMEELFLEDELESMRRPMDSSEVWPDRMNWDLGVRESELRPPDDDEIVVHYRQQQQRRKTDVLAANHLTTKRVQALLARLERARAEFLVVGEADPSDIVDSPRRRALVVAVPQDQANDDRVRAALRPIGSDAHLGRSRITPGRRVANGVTEWMTEIGPVVVRSCAPADWIDIHEHPDSDNLRARRAMIFDHVVQHLDNVQQTWAPVVHDVPTDHEIDDAKTDLVDEPNKRRDRMTEVDGARSPQRATAPARGRTHAPRRSAVPSLAPEARSTAREASSPSPSLLGVDGVDGVDGEQTRDRAVENELDPRPAVDKMPTQDQQTHDAERGPEIGV